MKPQFTYPLRVNEQNRALVDSIRRAAEALEHEPIVSLGYGNFILFGKTGSRVEYEEEYMLHRKMLSAFGGMALLDEDGERWLARLVDVIWAICDEFTWALPAHLSRAVTPRDYVERVDLFASETAFSLAELSAVLGERLPKLVRDRIDYELERRIVVPAKQGDQTYPKSNWASVCMAGITATLVYADRRAELDELLPYIEGNLQLFLDSYYDDGCCMEGMLYWEYGFGFFCYVADLLYRYTEGAVDYFRDEKVQRIAHFGQNCYFRGNHVISFSDSPHELKHTLGLWNLLSERFEGIVAPPMRHAALFGEEARYRFSTLIRSLYAGSVPTSEEIDHRIVYYPDSAWYIHKGFGYVFAAKAGHNDEPHNHNDVGTFELYDGGSYIVDDPGWPTYYKGYFGELRYENPVPASRGHSVPIIDSREQIPGSAAAGSVTSVGEHHFTISYADAYGNAGLRRLSRTFTLDAEGVTVRDEAEGEHRAFVSRFTTRIRPTVEGDAVRIGAWSITADQPADIVLSDFKFTPRFSEFKEKRAGEETVWCIDFVLSDPRGASFRIEKSAEE